MVERYLFLHNIFYWVICISIPSLEGLMFREVNVGYVGRCFFYYFYSVALSKMYSRTWKSVRVKNEMPSTNVTPIAILDLVYIFEPGAGERVSLPAMVRRGEM